MFKLKIFICVLFLNKTILLLANADSTKKSSKYFIDVNAGMGQFLFGKALFSETEKIPGVFTFSRPVAGGISFGKNFSETRSKKYHFKSYLSVGGGIHFLSYQIDHTINNYSFYNPDTYKNYVFSQNQCSYRVNMVNYSVFLSNSTLFEGNFFIRNKFGLALATYANKNDMHYTAHITGWGTEQNPGLMSLSNPGGYYTTTYNYDKTIIEKNYDKVSYNMFYSLSIGTKYKKIIYYASPEILLLNNRLNSVLKYQVGMIVEL